MTIQIEKPTTRNEKALVFISDMRTAAGTVWAFTFMRNEPRMCKITGCSRKLAAQNRSGMCRSHYQRLIGRYMPRTRNRKKRVFCVSQKRFVHASPERKTWFQISRSKLEGNDC